MIKLQPKKQCLAEALFIQVLIKLLQLFKLYIHLKRKSK